MSATTTTTAKIECMIVEAIVSFGPATETVTREATFESLDLDSLDLVELSQIIEEEFRVQLGTADVADLKTVGDAVDLVVARTS
ncbi:MAG TPA: phosphopantetheine-binding protein [Solirubrobacteraceae bacterium]|nr:phosphopantetheine-binding protein [Solirubrobacteraceae bacterium]